MESALTSYRQKVSPREAYPSMLTLPLPMRSVPPVTSVSRMSLACAGRGFVIGDTPGFRS